MQKIAKFLAVFMASTALVLPMPMAALAASKDDDSEEMSYGNFLEVFEDYQSGKFEQQEEYIAYKGNSTKKIEHGVVLNGKGTFVRNADGTYTSKASGVATAGTDKHAVELKIDTVLSGDYLYVRLKNAPNKAIRNKWIKVPLADVPAFEKALQIEGFIGVTAPVNPEKRELELMNATTHLINDMELFIQAGDAYYDKAAGRKAIRIDYVYDEEKVVPFFTELKKIFKTEEELDNSIFGTEGFEAGLKNDKFLKAFIDDSFGSVWLDAKTELPIQMALYDSIPTYGKRNERIAVFSYTSIREANKKQVIKTPTNTISMEEALEILDLELEK